MSNCRSLNCILMVPLISRKRQRDQKRTIEKPRTRRRQAGATKYQDFIKMRSSGLAVGGAEAITDARLGVKKARARLVGFDFVAQVGDVNAQRVRVIRVLFAPDFC